MTLTHPLPLLRRLGVSDASVLVVIIVVLASQAAMIISITRRFVLTAPDAGLEIARTWGWVGALMVTGMAAFGSVVYLFLREIKLARLRRAAEIIGQLPSLAPVPAELAKFAAVSDRPRKLQLAYHLVFADACYTSASGGIHRIVLGKSFGQLLRENPDAAAIRLAHEYSHVELGATSGERWARLLLKAYFLLLAGFTSALAATLAYLEPIVRSSQSVAALYFTVVPTNTSIWPSPDPAIMLRLVTPLIPIGVASVAVFVFSYFQLVRRELYHDFRAVQLTAKRQAGIQLHQASCQLNNQTAMLYRARRALWAFFRCHPTACDRAQCLRNGDVLLIDTRLYPLIVGSLLPCALLASDFLNPFSARLAALWTIPQTALVGLLINVALRADTVRFALKHRIGSGPSRLLVLAYAGMMGTGSALTGSILGFWYAYHLGHDEAWLLRNVVAQITIGLRTAVFFALLLGALSYLVTVRLRHQHRNSRLLVAGEAFVFGFTGILGFMLLSLTTGEFAIPLIFLLGAGIGAWLVCLIFSARCSTCGKLRPNILWLSTGCRNCGTRIDNRGDIMLYDINGTATL